MKEQSNALHKPVAIVSGATRGIGKAIALRLLKKGFIVIGLYKENDKAAASLADQGLRLHKVDVGSPQDVEQIVSQTVSEYERIDVVINNAGIDIPGPIETYNLNDWNLMVATDLTSVFSLTKYTIGHLKRSSNPIIINISSRLGVGSHAEPEFAVYSALKAAVNAFTIATAKELNSVNIRVNAIIPAPTKTDLFDEVFTQDDETKLRAQGRLGETNDVAELVLELINDRSANGRIVFDRRVAP